MSLLVGKTFRTLTDLLKRQFKPLKFFRRDILESTLDECGMATKEGNEHFPPFFCQRDRSNPPIFAAFYAADKAPLVKTIHRDADRPRVEIDLRTNGVYWHGSFVQ
jgi:hypothetical protein